MATICRFWEISEGNWKILLEKMYFPQKAKIRAFSVRRINYKYSLFFLVRHTGHERKPQEKNQQNPGPIFLAVHLRSYSKD